LIVEKQKKRNPAFDTSLFKTKKMQFNNNGFRKQEVNADFIQADSVISHNGKGNHTIVCGLAANAESGVVVNSVVNHLGNKVTIPQNAHIKHMTLVCNDASLIADNMHLTAGFKHAAFPAKSDVAAFLACRAFGKGRISGAALKKYGSVSSSQALEDSLADAMFQVIGQLEKDGTIIADGVPQGGIVGEPLGNMEAVIVCEGGALPKGAVSLVINYCAC
jgi:hypothetical protein